MASFLDAFGDLFRSFYKMLAAMVGTVIHLSHNIFSAIIHFFASILQLVQDTLGSLVNVAGGIGKFIAGNIVILGIVSAGLFLYVRSQQQQQQGRPAIGAKKTN